MKFFRGLLRLIIGLLTVLFVGVMILTSLPVVQRWLARQLSEEASRALGAEVRVENVYLTVLGYAQLDRIAINDLKGRQMLYASRLSGRVSLPQLFDKRVDMEHAQLYGLQAALRQDVPDSAWNFQFLVDALSGKGDTNKNPWHMAIRSVMVRRGQATVDCEYKPRRDEGMDPSHLAIEQLSFNGKVHNVEGGDVDVEVNRLSFREKCGFQVNDFAVHFIKRGSELSLPLFSLRMPNSYIAVSAEADSTGWKLRTHDASICTADLTPAFTTLPQLGTLDFVLSAEGDNSSCYIDTLMLENPAFSFLSDASIVFSPLDIRTTATLLRADVATLLREHVPSYPQSALIDSVTRRLGFEGQLVYTEQLAAVNGILTSPHGAMWLDARLNDLDSLKVEMNSEQFDLSPLSRQLGTMAIEMKGAGSLKRKTGHISALLPHIEVAGYDYHNVELAARYVDSLRTSLVVNDLCADVSLYASAHLQNRSINAEVDIRNVVPGLLQSGQMPDSTCYSGQMSLSATVPNNPLYSIGRMAVHQLRKDGELVADSLVLTSRRDKLQHITLLSDFMALNLTTSDLPRLIEQRVDTALTARVRLWDEAPLDSLLGIKLSLLDTLCVDVDGWQDNLLFKLGLHNQFRTSELHASAQGGLQRDSVWMDMTILSPTDHRVNGCVSVQTSRSDSTAAPVIEAVLRDVQVGYIMDLVNLTAIDFDGKATGTARVTGLGNGTPLIAGRVNVSDFTVNGADMGTTDIDIAYDFGAHKILLDGFISDPAVGQYASVVGDIVPGRRPDNGMRLDIKARRLSVAFLDRYTSSIFQDFQGRITGDVVMGGKMGMFDLVGDVVTDTVGMYIPVLGVGLESTTNDVIHLREGVFSFPCIHVVDGRGGSAEVSGDLRHTYFKNMSYDFDIKAEHLLGYNFHDFGDMPFYATAVATGGVSLHGKPGTLKVGVNCTVEKGTSLVYNSASPTGVTNAGFITYATIDTLSAVTDTLMVDLPVLSHQQTSEQTPLDLTINMELDLTSDAQLKVLTDPKSGDGVTLYGTGHIQAFYNSKRPFQMRGEYKVTSGDYSFSIQNFMRKSFEFRPGGTITFGGAPMDGVLNLQAAYPVYNVSLSDLSARATFARSGVRVDCIMNLGGKCEAPRVTFDFDLPNVNEDEKQMVRSLISTDEERNMQVLYLLGIGRFYSYDYDGTQGQGNLAMKSLLSSTLSSTLNNVISNAIGSNNWSFGTSIATGEIGWSDMDVEGLVSGRLFNNRLLLNGQFGYRDHTTTGTNFIGDFDLQWFLNRSGNIAVKAYSETNDRYFTKSALTTQGVGLVMKKDFNRFYEIFKRKKQ